MTDYIALQRGAPPKYPHKWYILGKHIQEAYASISKPYAPPPVEQRQQEGERLHVVIMRPGMPVPAIGRGRGTDRIAEGLGETLDRSEAATVSDFDHR